jgi:6-phosphogluconolactonase
MPYSSMTDPAVDVWCGFYGDEAKGVQGGILSIRLGEGESPQSDRLAPATRPSFIARHPTRPVVYVLNAGEDVAVGAYRTEAGHRFEPIGEAWSTGATPCHVAVDRDGRFLVVSCWGDGAVLLYELDSAGSIVRCFSAATAIDPRGGTRQSRAHAALQLSDGRIATTDLGLDLLRFWRFEEGVGLVVDHEVVLPLGSEPRHLALHSSGRLFVIGEASVRVFVLGETDGSRYTLETSVQALGRGARDGDAASEISIDSKEGYVYVAVRGSNRIATLAIRDGGATLEPLADVDCGGDHPRHHLLARDRLLVANQHSDSIAILHIDSRTGIPSELGGRVPIAGPTCLVSAT